MWYSVYETATKRLLSVGEKIDQAVRDNPELFVLESVDRPDFAKQEWDEKTGTYIGKKIRSTNRIPRATLLDRLGVAAEQALQSFALKDNDDGNWARAFLLRFSIATDVDMDDPRTIEDLARMVTLGIVDEKRAALARVPVFVG